MTLDDLRRDVLRANLALVEHGLVHGSFGNVSGVDRETGVLVIKPSGVPYAELTPETMACVDLASGARIDGLAPSSDTPTHRVVYLAFAEVGGVAHTHSPWATAWAQACRPIPCLGTTHADYFRGEIPCTRRLDREAIDGDYEAATGRAIVSTFEPLEPLDVPGVLVASHGPFAWGLGAADAVASVAALEFIASLAYHTLNLDAAANPVAEALRERHFLRKHGPAAYYGQREAVR